MKMKTETNEFVLAFSKETFVELVKEDQKEAQEYLDFYVKPHMNKFTCFLVPPGGGSPLGGSDSLSTIGPELSHLTAVKPPGPHTG